VPRAKASSPKHEVAGEGEQKPPPIFAAAGTTGERRVLLEAPLDSINETNAVMRQVEGRRRRLGRACGIRLVAHDGLFLPIQMFDRALSRGCGQKLANKLSVAEATLTR
jgi:hypothetical protein